MVVMPDTDFRVLNKIKDEQMVNVAMTRAMHELYVNYNGELPTSLKSLSKK